MDETGGDNIILTKVKDHRTKAYSNRKGLEYAMLIAKDRQSALELIELMRELKTGYEKEIK